MCSVFTNQQTKPPTGNLPKRNQPSHAQFSQAKYVGAAPVCPPERPHSGVSILKNTRIVRGVTMDAPLWGDTGGHTGTAPTNLHHIFPHNPTQTKFRPCVIYPNDINRPPAICPNETVGAVPACPPERPRSGVSIPKNTRIVRWEWMMDAPLQGDTGGHTGTAPTNLHYIFPRNSTQTK